MSEDPQFPDPRDVVEGYETDLSAVGTNRTVDPALVDDTPWYELHPETARELGLHPREAGQ